MAHISGPCATAKFVSVAQHQEVRHAYLAMAHNANSAPRIRGLPISLFLVVLCPRPVEFLFYFLINLWWHHVARLTLLYLTELLYDYFMLMYILWTNAC